MLRILISTGWDTLLTTVAVCAILAPFLIHDYTRPVVVFTARFIISRAPWWAMPVIVACQFIIGPVDDAIALAVLAYPIFKSAANRETYAVLMRMLWKELDA